MRGWGVLLGVAAGVAAGCAGGDAALDDPGDSATDTGATPPEPGEPASACVDYLACLTATGDDKLPLAQEAFGEGAACWSDPLLAYDCAVRCEEGTLAQRAVEPLESACWGEGMTPAAILFQILETTWPLGPASASGECPAVLDQYERLGITPGLGLAFELVLEDQNVSGSQPDRVTNCTLQTDFSFTCEPPWTIGFAGPQTRVAGAFLDDLGTLEVTMTETSGGGVCTLTSPDD